MTQVTYRGVPYDSEEYKKKVLSEATQERNFELMYRGTAFTKKRIPVPQPAQ